MGLNHRRNVAILSLLALVIVLPYNNCAKQSVSSTNSGSLQFAGDGDSYDGKPDPGDYYRVVPGFKCNAVQEAPEKLTVTATGATLTETASDCSQSTRALTFAQIDYSDYNRNLLGVDGGGFEKLAAPPTPSTPSETVEVFCRAVGSTHVDGRDAVIKIDRTSKVLRAEVRSPTGTQAFTGLARVTASGSVSYSAANFALDVNGLSGADQTFSGALSGAAGNYALNCRMGSGLDVLAQTNLPAMAFQVLGIRGGSDFNEDAFLSDWTGRTVVWQKLDSGLSYSASIYDAGNTNLVCPAVATTSDRVNLTCSAFQPATNYTIRVTGSTVYGNSFIATNQNFSFLVSPVSASNIANTPAPARAGQTVTFSTNIISSIALNNVNVHFIVYDANWNLLPNEVILSGQNFAANSPRIVTGSYLLPNLAGTYWMQVFVFDSTYATSYISAPVNYRFQADP